jgi:hypothetical protein
MQLLLMLTQYLLRTPLHKRKTASEQLMDETELLPMRFALGRAGIGRRAVWYWCKPILEKSVLLSLPEAPDGNRNRDPRRDCYESTEKNPSAATDLGVC